MWACRYNNIEIVKMLIDKGANLDLQDVDRWTALTYICINNNIELTSYILEYI